MVDIEALKKYAYDTIGAIHEVHKELGPGLNEKIYQEGLQLELTGRGIPFQKELSFHPFYHGIEMESTYRLDFLVQGDIVVELKAVEELISEHKSQLFNCIRKDAEERSRLATFLEKIMFCKFCLFWFKK